MENVAEALKIAFAVMLFVMALTLSISSFSQATSAVNAITNLRDRETDYTYVEPSENLSRIVGIETVISTIYNSRSQNIEIYFFKSDGTTPLPIYNDVDAYWGESEISHIDFIELSNKIDFFDVLLGGNTVDNWLEVKEKYEPYLIYENGLYDEFKNCKFEERLGEYFQGEKASEIKKRVITYILQPSS